MNWRFTIACTALCSCSISEPMAADMREVMRIVEQDEARLCELETAKEKVYRECPGSPERARLEGKLKETEAAVERARREKHQTLEELSALMAPLSVAEQNQIRARVQRLRQRCYMSFGPYPAQVCTPDTIQVSPTRRLEPMRSAPQGVQPVPSESAVR